MKHSFRTVLQLVLLCAWAGCDAAPADDLSAGLEAAIGGGKADQEGLYVLNGPIRALWPGGAEGCLVNTPCEYRDALRHTDAALLAAPALGGGAEPPADAFVEIAAYAVSASPQEILISTSGRVRLYVVRLSDRAGAHHEGSAILPPEQEYRIVVYPQISQCYGLCLDRTEPRVEYTISAQAN